MTRRPDTITEAEFQRAVIALLKKHGWRYYSTSYTRRRIGGFPDLIALKGNRMLALELKTDIGKVSEEQDAWLKAFSLVYGCDAYVLRPGHSQALFQAILDDEELPFG